MYTHSQLNHLDWFSLLCTERASWTFEIKHTGYLDSAYSILAVGSAVCTAEHGADDVRIRRQLGYATGSR